MNCDDLIARLEEIKQMAGNMPIYVLSDGVPTPLVEGDVILISNNNSLKYQNGVYIYVNKD